MKRTINWKIVDMRHVRIEQDEILIDGNAVRLISGAIHYFRVHPDLWKDRLEKAKAMGINTIETYMPWNLHEPQKNKFDFSGMQNVEKFIKIAGDMGFMVIMRPGPYICAEWEFGGLPGWLTTVPGIKLRCSNVPYLKRVEGYFNEILPRIKKYQWTEGGPIIALQIENEYGSYGQDKQYLQFIKELYDKHGFGIPYLTSDGPTDSMLLGGTLPGIWATVNFGTKAPKAFVKLREYEEGPMMCMEFWNGWFDHWDKPHHTRDTDDAALCLKEMLDLGAHVNFYMFHGGTNFGFMNGANFSDGKYLPTVNSYDYDAPLSESGDPTLKYMAFRKVIAEHVPGLLNQKVPGPSVKEAYGKVELTQFASLFNNLSNVGKIYSTVNTDSMEEFGQNYGFILYSKRVSGPVENATLTLQQPRDRAIVFINGKEEAVIYRNDENHSINLEIPPEGLQVDILIENMGRVNYGDNLSDARKGITNGIRIMGQFQFGWNICSLPLDDLSKLDFSIQAAGTCPAFFKGEFAINKACDTFVKVSTGKKGICWINGFNLGRYWEVGPQKTLYIPAPLLKQGKNEIIVFEQHSIKEQYVEFLDKPEIG